MLIIKVNQVDYFGESKNQRADKHTILFWQKKEEDKHTILTKEFKTTQKKRRESEEMNYSRVTRLSASQVT